MESKSISKKIPKLEWKGTKLPTNKVQDLMSQHNPMAAMGAEHSEDDKQKYRMDVLKYQLRLAISY